MSMTEVREVAFELERFGWTAPGRLEVMGRWSGLEGRRLGRPVLTLELNGRRTRFSAVPGGDSVPAEGEAWHAAFAFEGVPGDVGAAELAIGRRLVVPLPPPRRSRSVRESADRLQADLITLRAEVSALRAELEARTDELATARTDLAARNRATPGAVAASEVEPLRAELAAARADRDRVAAELRAARGADADVDRLAGREEELAGLRAQLAELAADRERLAAEARAAADGRAALSIELARARAGLTHDEAEREQLMAEMAQLRSDLAEREEELSGLQVEVQDALARAEERRDEAQRTSEFELQESARLRAQLQEANDEAARLRDELGTARDEAAQRIDAEGREADRLRAELQAARHEADDRLAAAHEEVARLRDALAGAATADGGAGDELYERMSAELERERELVRTLRDELDAGTAEHHRSAGLEGTPAAATPAGRAASARRTAAPRAGSVAAHRHYEPRPPSTASIWAVRILAAALVAVLLIALLTIVASVA